MLLFWDHGQVLQFWPGLGNGKLSSNPLNILVCGVHCYLLQVVKSFHYFSSAQGHARVGCHQHSGGLPEKVGDHHSCPGVRHQDRGPGPGHVLDCLSLLPRGSGETAGLEQSLYPVLITLYQLMHLEHVQSWFHYVSTKKTLFVWWEKTTICFNLFMNSKCIFCVSQLIEYCKFQVKSYGGKLRFEVYSVVPRGNETSLPSGPDIILQVNKQTKHCSVSNSQVVCLALGFIGGFIIFCREEIWP